MKIKKYEAASERDAIELIKQELGTDALVLNIKKTQPKGVLAFWRKSRVEVTAAYDEKGIPVNPQNSDSQSCENDGTANREAQSGFGNALKAAEDIQTIAQSDIVNKSVIIPPRELKKLSSENNSPKKYDGITRTFYNTLLTLGVNASVAAFILSDAARANDADINASVKAVYAKLIQTFGAAVSVEERLAEKKPSAMFFFGPSGMGKTTTIVKLAARYKNDVGLNVGLITTDTERVGAAEQLKAYATIIGLDLKIAYSPKDLSEHMDALKTTKDVVLIDTPACSHQNSAAMESLAETLRAADASDRFLVLSATTKHEDLMEMIGTYSKYCDFSLIFTKLDETPRIGAMLNICRETGDRIAYTSNGQNPPRGIEAFRPENAAKALMGLGRTTT